MFEIIFYETSDKKKPVEDFLRSMDKKLQVKTLQEISLLKEFGNELREPYSKALSNGVFELRIKQGSNIARVLYFFYFQKKIVITNGFIKKTQKPLQRKLKKHFPTRINMKGETADGRF